MSHVTAAQPKKIRGGETMKFPEPEGVSCKV